MSDPMMAKAYAHSCEDLIAALHVNPDMGLDKAALKEKRRRYGHNLLRRHETKSVYVILRDQFKSIIIWLLAAAALLSFALGDIAEGIAIVFVLLINGLIGFFTELRAVRSMESLSRISQVRTHVRRDGRVRAVDARSLVPGDIVILDAGDIVTADLRLLEAANLQCDESVLTGEAVPVAKHTDPIGSETHIGDRVNMVFKGTAITQGSGEGVVVATGMATEIGQISDLVQKATDQETPLERRLDRLGYKLVWLTLALASFTVLVGALRGQALTDMVQISVALAVAAIPEGLPVVATLCLARGMWRMAERNALILTLSAVETLGATTIILTDKTGTLTENRMRVVRYIVDGLSMNVGDDTADPIAGIECAEKPSQSQKLSWAIKIGALCNAAELGDDPKSEGTGDPMEVALLVAARDADYQHHRLLEEYPLARNFSFDPDLKMMATLHRDADGYLLAVKGAPESVIEICDRVLGDAGPQELTDSSRAHWQQQIEVLAKQGFRLLGLAMKKVDIEDDKPYAELVLIGLVCFEDPLRSGVPATIRATRDAGVRVVMLTGDHADTAVKIAGDAGLGSGELIAIEGKEFANLDISAMSASERERLLSADVFARVTPSTKMTLVTLHQEAGDIVAMTGDGVNDAPALKKADIGIAMGMRGTQVAREASDVVLKDDAFDTIVAAMRQGRIIFDNIRKFVVYLMSCNVSEVLVIGIAVGIGLPIPLLPLQILFLNLVTDVFPAFALGLGPGTDDIMHQPPRDPKEPVIDRSRWIMIAVLGSSITAITLSAFAIAIFWLHLGDGPSVTVAFLTLALAQLWNVFNVRMPESGIVKNEVTRNIYIWGALLICIGLISAALWMPGLSEILGLPSPGPIGLLLALGASLVQFLAGQIYLEITASKTSISA